MRTKANRIMVLAAALVVAFSLLAWEGSASASEPVVTDDIVLLSEDSYVTGQTVMLAMRNDGDVAYKYNQYQQACYLRYEDATGRSFKIPPATHCDIANEAEIAPGESVTLLHSWALNECTRPGFFCYGVRPLPSGDYTISGSLQSAAGEEPRVAEFSKTIAITGPRFSSGVSAAFGVVISDPPQGPQPVFLSLFNNDTVAYRVPQAECYLTFKKPDGTLFSIPPVIQCDYATEQLLAPGSHLDAFRDWNRDECSAFVSVFCDTTAPLPPGVYIVEGALWSEDRQSYAEFSTSYTITGATATPSPTPSPTSAQPVVLPRSGGPAEDPRAVEQGVLGLGALLALIGATMMSASMPLSLSAVRQRRVRAKASERA